jgi:hypothetical protein
VQVVVHGLGAVPSPATDIVLRGRGDQVIASGKIPALAGPLDLVPKTTTVVLKLPKGATTAGCTVEIDPAHTLNEITLMNNAVSL